MQVQSHSPARAPRLSGESHLTRAAQYIQYAIDGIAEYNVQAKDGPQDDLGEWAQGQFEYVSGYLDHAATDLVAGIRSLNTRGCDYPSLLHDLRTGLALVRVDSKAAMDDYSELSDSPKVLKELGGIRETAKRASEILDHA